MSVVLTVGDRQVRDDEMYSLLVEYQLLPHLAREILLDQAVAHIQLTPEEQQENLGLFYQQTQITNEEQRQAWLKQSGMTLEQLEASILRTARLEKFKHQTWDDQLEGHFLNSKDKLDQVIYSLIRSRDSGIIQELYFRIQEGEGDFSALARQYSEGPEAQNGGLIGPVELNVPHPQIVQLLKSTPAGQLCLPVAVGEWWILLRLEKYISSQLDDNIRQRLRNDLFQTWLSQQIQTKIEFAVPSPPETSQIDTDLVVTQE
ncbi:peptidylprolyl isomerase [Synechocystis sp. FACHB-383]|uniref:peptidylprolyl isomerase n=1 Tax=Synechocystis sp. FACHB-383 TaxID=2692864 RepID=UPI0016894C97|nr:peptidylprolyl isomerase [Synechocystis sp. FACHB-383]MBD2652769.1 peptidylprolyl isomerase [Synechocystis sp. FACHB-383]